MDFASLINGKGAPNSVRPDYESLIKKAGDDFKPDFGPCFFVKSIDKKKRRLTALVSTPDIDRQDEIIKPEAFKEHMPTYMANPVVISCHQHRLTNGSSSVVGNVVGWKLGDEGLLVEIEFTEIALGEEYWQLYSTKKQRAFSVGFIPIEGGFEEIDGRRVYVHTVVELLEISCVPVPANRQALSKSRQRKREFVEAKRQDRELDKIIGERESNPYVRAIEELEEKEFIDELRAENPGFDEDAEEFARLLLAPEEAQKRAGIPIVLDDEENGSESEIDFKNLITGERSVYVALVS